MGKYCSGLTTEEVCNLEVDEMYQILDEYSVNPCDKEKIADMIREAYFQLGESYKHGRQYEAFIKDKLGNKGVVELFKMLTRQIPAGKHLSAEMESELKKYQGKTF